MGENKSRGAQLIADERERQRRRWTDAGDDRHTAGELATCAELIAGDVAAETAIGERGDPWPRERAAHVREKYGENRIARLAIAGALIAAEIDRLIRAKLAEEAAGHD